MMDIKLNQHMSDEKRALGFQRERTLAVVPKILPRIALYNDKK